MADSEFVFEAGNPVEVGAAGGHDFVFAAGSHVEDRGQSDVVFEAGTGIGPADWKIRFVTFGSGTTDQYTTSIGGDPFLEMSHTGKNDGEGNDTFGIFYRDNPVASTFELTYNGVDYTKNELENNFTFGVAATTSKRPFDNTDVDSIQYFWKQDGIVDFEVETGGSTTTQETGVTSPSGDFTVGFDGSEAYAIIDGSEVARISAPSNTYYPTFSLEDDGTFDVGETVSAASVLEKEI